LAEKRGRDLAPHLFTREQARQIIDFVKKCHMCRCEGILVHCKAGISRSAAVAKWIAERHKLDFPADYSLFNQHVYATLQAEHGRNQSRC